jgi:hypothetical protein
MARIIVLAPLLYLNGGGIGVSGETSSGVALLNFSGAEDFKTGAGRAAL